MLEIDVEIVAIFLEDHRTALVAVVIKLEPKIGRFRIRMRPSANHMLTTDVDIVDLRTKAGGCEHRLVQLLQRPGVSVA